MKPKKSVQTKTKIDKVENVNDQIRSANENSEYLMLGELNFDPKEILK